MTLRYAAVSSGSRDTPFLDQEWFGGRWRRDRRPWSLFRTRRFAAFGSLTTSRTAMPIDVHPMRTGPGTDLLAACDPSTRPDVLTSPHRQSVRMRMPRPQTPSGTRTKGIRMKIVVTGGTGLIGSKVVARLNQRAHQAVPAAPSVGVNTLTGEGVKEVLRAASVVVDVSNSPSFADDDVMTFFRTSTTNLLNAAVEAGVGHYVALSVVGCDRLPESGYMRAKAAQERPITGSSLPCSVVHATQFFEFAGGIADSATADGKVRLSDAGVQPVAAEEAAGADPTLGVVGASVTRLRVRCTVAHTHRPGLLDEGSPAPSSSSTSRSGGHCSRPRRTTA